MAKLYFRYGAMSCGKSAALLQVAYNYDKNNLKSVILKPSIDKKGANKIVSRIGLERKVDYVVGPADRIDKILDFKDLACILVDESQFFSKTQITDLWHITKELDIPVICYGIKTDFKTNGFPGSIRLFELADELEELKTICECGKTARFNVRKIAGEYTFRGDQVAIDGIDAEYEPMCGECYIKHEKESKK